MKTISLLKQNLRKFLLLVLVAVASFNAKAQQGLIFLNPVIESGSAGADGTVYRFPLVNNNLDALVKIVGRSSALVTLTDIDLTSTGWQKAWQPQLSYNNGNVTGALDYWMEFKFTFVNKTTSTPANIQTFDVTALDIDGNGTALREWNSFYGSSSYVLEGISQLSVNNLLGTLVDLLVPGKKFVGSLTNYSGIDTSVTSIMTTLKFNYKNTFSMRIGGSTTGSVTDADRMSSFWFKSFQYTAPQTLPVSLTSFTATLNNNKADLKWTTTTEINISHFTIEKSYDGKNYADAGIVFAAGSTTDKTNYNFSDNVNPEQAGVIYYRLRITDLDGKGQYSETRIIQTGKTTKNAISILTYPNPATNELRITIPNNWQNKKVTYELYGGNGSAARQSVVSNASQTQTLDISSLSPGLYIIKVSCNGEIAQQKIIKH